MVFESISFRLLSSAVVLVMHVFFHTDIVWFREVCDGVGAVASAV